MGVLDQFQRLYLTEAIHQTAPVDFLDGVIYMFGIAKWLLEYLHEQVMAFDDEVLIQRLWKDWCDCKNPNIRITAFWSDEYEFKALLFYTSRRFYDRLVACGMDENTPKSLSNKALEVADVIERHAPWRRS
ncbi:MAG: hypothetical protein L3J30_15555 [Marinosulfonomonas sp.]|nr:hypothetical protein [Marinosulfonomonas sp.]